MDSERKLEGIELRKAALEAAGWEVEKRPNDIYAYNNLVLKNPRGESISEYFECDADGGDYHDFYTEADAWQHAPAVESSVDAALQWLTLDEHRAWWILWPVSNPDWPSGQVTIKNYLTGCTDGASFKTNAAEAMCRAYLAHKAGV